MEARDMEAMFGGLGSPPTSPRMLFNSTETHHSPPTKDSIGKAVADHNVPPKHIVGETFTTPLNDSSFPSLPKSSAAKANTKLDAATTHAVPKSYGKSTKTRGKIVDEANAEASGPTPNVVQEGQRLIETQPETSTSGSNKPQPGKLDTSVGTSPARRGVDSAASKPSTPVMPMMQSSITPTASSRSDTLIASTDTPAKRSTLPRMSRVAAVPTAETSPQSSAGVTGASPVITARASPDPGRYASRKASLTSITRSGTPASERNADTASVTTDSISRASSPPPSRVGSAPARAKSKSQAKKDRLERAKTLAEADDATGSGSGQVSEPLSVEPIMGRKKKTKSKKASTMPTSTSTPDVSRPASPRASSKQERPAVEATAIPSSREDDSETGEAQVVVNPDRLPAEPESSQRDLLAPAIIIQELTQSEELGTRLGELFKAGFSTAVASGKGSQQERQELTAEEIMNMATPSPLSAAEIAALNRGEAVRREGTRSARLMISPSKKCLPRLARDLEDRYLELEKRVLSSKPPTKYFHQKKESSHIMQNADQMLTDMTAVLTRRPATHKEFPPMGQRADQAAQPTSSGDTKAPTHGPPSTLYASDALAYLNQFILPPLPQGPRPSRVTPHTASGALLNAAASQGLLAPPSPAAAPLGIGSAVPRTYTTGDPTYSVSGVDVNLSSADMNLLAQNAVSVAAASVGGLDSNIPLAGQGRAANLGATASPEAIKQALAEAVNGVVQAAAGLARVSDAQAHAGGGMQTGATAANAAAGLNLRSLGNAITPEDLESTLMMARRENEAMERKFAGLVRRNKKIAGLL